MDKAIAGALAREPSPLLAPVYREFLHQKQADPEKALQRAAGIRRGDR